MIHSTGERKPNDPKLSDGGGWRAGCTVGGKVAAEAASVTAGAVRCSAWLGVPDIMLLRLLLGDNLKVMLCNDVLKIGRQAG